MGRPLGQALPHRLYPPPLPKYKCSTLHSAWCGLPLRVGLALWRRRGLELLLAALALCLASSGQRDAASRRRAIQSYQLGLDDEANSKIADGYATGSPARRGVAVGDLPTSSVGAPQLILQTLGSAPTPPLSTIHNPCILVVQDGDSAKDSAHGGSGSDLCRQTCSGWTGGNLPRYLLPAHRPPRSRSDTLLFTLDAESFSGV